MAHKVLERLQADGRISAEDLQAYAYGFELGVGTSIHAIRGLLDQAIKAGKEGKKGIFIHPEQLEEAAIVKGIQVMPASDLEEVVGHISGEKLIQAVERDTREIFAYDQQQLPNDMAEIIEDENAKHALEVAAIGNHHCLLYGDPRSGKDRLIEHLPATLARMSLQEALAVTLRHSELGKLPSGSGLMAHRPYSKISPFTSVKAAKEALYLSHQGIIHVQDVSEVSDEVLRLLEEVFQESKILMEGKHHSCQVMCVASSSEAGLPDFLQRFFDLYIEVPIIEPEDHLRFDDELESSLHIRERVEAARDIQQARFANVAEITSNADIPLDQLENWVQLDAQTKLLLTISLKKQGIDPSFRPQILRVSRSIADRVGEEQPLLYHVAEAVQYMSILL